MILKVFIAGVISLRVMLPPIYLDCKECLRKVEIDLLIKEIIGIYLGNPVDRRLRND